MNEQIDDHSLERTLEIAISALHVIAVMGEMESKQVSDIAMDALREMETYGLLYELFDTEEQPILFQNCPVIEKICPYAGVYKGILHCGLQKGSIEETKLINITKCPKKPKKRRQIEQEYKGITG